jgi:hypothetical protein
MWQMISWIEQFPEGRRWHDAIIKATRTHEVYFRYFKLFCDEVKLNPTQLAQLLKDCIAKQDYTTVPDLMHKVIPAMTMKNGKPYSPRSINRTEVAICSFFKHNNIPFRYPTTYTPTNLSPSAKYTPDLADIKLMANTKIPTANQNLYDTRNSALVWFIESTGVRPEQT